MNVEIELQNTVQVLLLGGDAGHDLVHLRHDGAEEGGGAEEQEDAVHLPSVLSKKLLSRNGKIGAKLAPSRPPSGQIYLLQPTRIRPRRCRKRSESCLQRLETSPN